MREVPSDQHVARFAPEPIAHPGGRIAWLQITCRGKLGQRVAGPPERLRRLPRAKLAAVPHDRRKRATGRSLGRGSLRLGLAARREGPPRVDFGTDRLGVVNQKQFHGLAAGEV